MSPLLTCILYFLYNIDTFRIIKQIIKKAAALTDRLIIFGIYPHIDATRKGYKFSKEGAYKAQFDHLDDTAELHQEYNTRKPTDWTAPS